MYTKSMHNPAHLLSSLNPCLIALSLSVSGATLYSVNNAGFSSLPEMNSLFTSANGVFNFSSISIICTNKGF